MKAMIFAAGLGTRLKPLTDHCPKALVPVAGQPMLELLIGKLKEAGFDELVINVHHFADQIRDFLQAHENFGMQVVISDETDCLLDTGGGLAKAAPLLNREPNTLLPTETTENLCRASGYLIHNVDILSNVDLKELCNDHAAHAEALATLLVSPRKTQRYLLFDDQLRLQGWVNKATGDTKPAGFVYEPGRYREYAYSGIQVVSPALLQQLPQGKYSIVDYYLSICLQQSIRCFVKEDLKLMDIGKPETLEQAEEFLKAL